MGTSANATDRVARTQRRAARETQPEALHQAGDAVGVHLESVALAELSQRLRVGRRDAAEIDELGEELLEPGGGDDLEDPRRFVAGVPEGVPPVARLVDQVAGRGDHHLVAQQGAHAPLDHVAVLVLAQVPVQRRRERVRRHRVLDQREPLRGLPAVDHETHSDAAEEPCLAVTRTDDLGGCLLHQASPLNGQ
jgi:hypothetical protein